MLTQEIPIEGIDLQNETFRISEDLESKAVYESLRNIGQLNPVILLEQKANRIVVSGFRRIRAMKLLGSTSLLARILHETTVDHTRIFDIALWDNMSHRQLNPLEKARVLFNLRNSFGVPDEILIRTYLPLLDLSPAGNVLWSHIRLHQVNPALRQHLADGRLTYSSIDIIAEMPSPAQDRIADLMSKIRLSASLQKKLLDLLEDLAIGCGGSPAEALNRPEIVEAENDPRLSPFQRGEKVFQALYRLRNPRLAQATDQFFAQKKQLGLPGAIRIKAHPFFEEPGLHVEFDAPDPEHFRDLASALQKAAHSPELQNLYKW